MFLDIFAIDPFPAILSFREVQPGRGLKGQKVFGPWDRTPINNRSTYLDALVVIIVK